MRKINWFICSLVISSFVYLFSSTEIFGQKTFIYSKPDIDYRTGIDLFEKQQYGSAQKQFQKVIKGIENGELRMESGGIFANLAVDDVKNISLLKSNSEFYYAACAMKLLNDDAEELMTSFISRNTESPKAGLAYFELAKFQYMKKESSKAVQSFLKVDIYNLTQEEKDEYNFKLGYSYLRINKNDDAMRCFAEVKDRKNKYQNPAIYYYSHIAYTKKNYQAAAEGFKKLMDDPKYGNLTPYYIVQIYYIQGKYDELLKIAPKLIDSAKTKKGAEIARITGESYYRTGKYKEAIPYLVKYRENAENGVTTREDDYDLAFAYYKTADYKKALKQFEKVTNKDDSLSQNSNYHIADCYLKTSQKQFARNAFLAASKLSFDKVIQEDALYNYCKLSYELALNPYNEAITSIQKFLNAYPHSTRADEMTSYLVNIYLTTKNYKDALTSIESIKNKNEKIRAAYQKVSYCRGIELFSNKDYKTSIALFNKSISIEREKNYTPKSAYWKAEAYYRMGNLDSASAAYKIFLITPGAYSLSFYNVANYNIGYCYFKKKNYNDALYAFKKFVSDSIHQKKDMLNDAFNRLGDCYFVTKDNQEAIAYYNKGIKIRKVDADYALYQKALALGVMGKFEEKAEALKTILRDYKKSNYAMDAEYELASTYLSGGNNPEALKTFEKLIADYPKSAYVKRSILKIGLIERNMNNEKIALATFKKVVTTYPNTPESKEALVGIRNIYVDQNQVDSFFVYVKNIPFANITNAAQDSISYVAVENRYMSGDCAKSVIGFEDYIKKFPDGIFIVEAHYYKAECEYSLQNYEEALKGYSYVISKPVSKFSENAMLKSAEINYNKKNYAAAAENYKLLESQADYKNDITIARTGQMRTSFMLNNYPAAISASRKLLTTPKLTNDLMQEAHLTIAKSALIIDSLELAKKEFAATNKLGTNEMAAESKYNIAFIQYRLGNYDESEKLVFELINQVPSYDYWIAKGFILLADDYLKAGNVFQAKQTLHSVIENYEGAELKKVAQDKLNEIVAKEKIEEQKKSQKEMDMKFGKDSTEFEKPLIKQDTSKVH